MFNREIVSPDYPGGKDKREHVSPEDRLIAAMKKSKREKKDNISTMNIAYLAEEIIESLLD